MNRDPLKVQLIWNMQLMQIMKNFVMMNNHSVALNVTRNLQLNSDTLWMCNLMNPTMKQLVTWTTIQQLVTRNLQIEPPYKNSGSPQPRGGRPVLHRTGSHGGSLLNKFPKLGWPWPPCCGPPGRIITTAIYMYSNFHAEFGYLQKLFFIGVLDFLRLLLVYRLHHVFAFI